MVPFLQIFSTADIFCCYATFILEVRD